MSVNRYEVAFYRDIERTRKALETIADVLVVSDLEARIPLLEGERRIKATVTLERAQARLELSRPG